jgi:hypothetical protein
MAWLSKRGSVYYIKYWFNGHTRKTSTGTNTYQIAKEKLRQFEGALARGGEESSLPTRTSIGDALTAYVQMSCRGNTPGTSTIPHRNR